MTNNLPVELQNKIDKLGFTSRDDLIDVVKILTSCAGSVIAIGTGFDASTSINALLDFIPKQKYKRFEELIIFLITKVHEHDIKFKQEYVRTDEFVFLSQKIVKGVLDHYQEIKLLCFQGILVNSLRLNVDQHEREYYLHLVENLTETHLHILALFYQPLKYWERYDQNPDCYRGLSLKKVLTSSVGIKEDVLKPVCEDLHRMGLTNTPGPNIFGAKMTPNGIPQLKGRLTPFGISFIKFCTDFENE